MRKNYRDNIRRERLRGNKGSLFDELDYTGDLTPTLRPMTLVLSARLQLGQTFPESNLIKLIAISAAEIAVPHPNIFAFASNTLCVSTYVVDYSYY